MPVLLRSCVTAALLASPAAALACSCTWSVGSVGIADDATVRAAAASVPFIADGEILAVTQSVACRAPAADNQPAIPVYRTLRVLKAIKGSLPGSIEVRAGEVTPMGNGCVMMVNSCEVRPEVGASGVWALTRRNEEWHFAGVCATDAVRRTVAADHPGRSPRE